MCLAVKFKNNNSAEENAIKVLRVYKFKAELARKKNSINENLLEGESPGKPCVGSHNVKFIRKSEKESRR